jgi:hypothetical protein
VVYAQCRDAAGNVSARVSDSITLPPVKRASSSIGLFTNYPEEVFSEVRSQEECEEGESPREERTPYPCLRTSAQ